MMKEGADVYRVRDNQREATLIIVIGVLGLCRSVVQRERSVRARERVNYARRGSKSRHHHRGYVRACSACTRARERIVAVHT